MLPRVNSQEEFYGPGGVKEDFPMELNLQMWAECSLDGDFACGPKLEFQGVAGIWNFIEMPSMQSF